MGIRPGCQVSDFQLGHLHGFRHQMPRNKLLVLRIITVYQPLWANRDSTKTGAD